VGSEVLAQRLAGVGLAGAYDGEGLQQVVPLAGGVEDLAQDVEFVVAEEAVAGEVVDGLAGAGEEGVRRHGGRAVPGAGWVV
jgi:hypothetical protein